MKKAKKLTSIFVLIAMLFMIAAPAMAADPVTSAGQTGTITIDNAKDGGTYTAYKIFDVTYQYNENDKENGQYAYTIAGDSAWFSTVQSYAKGENSGLTLEQISGTNTYNVVVDMTKFDAPKFAVALNAVTDKTGGTTIPVNNGSATVNGLALGYYFVTTTTGSLCNLTTTNPTVTIQDKNDVPFDKVDDKESVEIGETVTYTITGKVPVTESFTEYDYEFADTMSNGLTFNKDVVVKVDGTPLSLDNGDYTVTYDVDGNANSFKVKIDVMKQSAKVGKDITVTYTAKVNENAVATIEKNKATLTYSNNPSDKTSHKTTPEDEETVYSAKIVIDKFAANPDDENDMSGAKLAGAQFKLYKMDGTNKLYYQYTEAKVAEGDNPAVEADVNWVAVNDATVVTTDNQGAANFVGLADGTYYLEEIEAPAGYNKLTEPKEIVINGKDADGKPVVAQLSTTAQVPNNTGALLPSTGGIGTTIFYVVGAALVLGAGVLLVTKKRMTGQR